MHNQPEILKPGTAKYMLLDVKLILSGAVPEDFYMAQERSEQDRKRKQRLLEYLKPFVVAETIDVTPAHVVDIQFPPEQPDVQLKEIE